MTAASAQVVGVDADVLNMLDQHGSQSLFTSPAWLETIASTYGFKPMASRTADSALLFVEVDDIRSRRVVSFPFSDYCDPTLSSVDEWSSLVQPIVDLGLPATFRLLHAPAGLATDDPRFTVTEPGLWHDVDTTRPPEQMWDELHGQARQNVRRAKRDGLKVRVGTSLDDVMCFHELHCSWRRTRYSMLAQPRPFFARLHELFIAQDQGFVLFAEEAGQPVGALFVLTAGDAAFYKFNASNDRSSRPNDLLAWVAMKIGFERGLSRLDFGFSDLDQPGLRRFKQKFATRERPIRVVQHTPEGWDPQASEHAGKVLSQLTDLFIDPLVPADMVARAGDNLYRYFA